MDEKLQSDDGRLRRRWFQFRISTWFVLVAILAWAIITPVYHDKGYLEENPGPHPERGRLVAITRARSATPPKTPDTYTYIYRRFNWLFLGPPLTLAAFVGWKAARQIIVRRSKNGRVGQS